MFKSTNILWKVVKLWRNISAKFLSNEIPPPTIHPSLLTRTKRVRVGCERGFDIKIWHFYIFIKDIKMSYLCTQHSFFSRFKDSSSRTLTKSSYKEVITNCKAMSAQEKENSSKSFCSAPLKRKISGNFFLCCLLSWKTLTSGCLGGEPCLSRALSGN